MLTVDIGVGHQNALVVANLGHIELFADACSERGDQRLNFGVGQCAVEAGAFDVQNLSTQRQDGLGFWVAATNCRTTGRVTLNDVDF